MGFPVLSLFSMMGAGYGGGAGGGASLASGGAGGSAVDTELGALRQMLAKNIEMTFKTFA